MGPVLTGSAGPAPAPRAPREMSAPAQYTAAYGGAPLATAKVAQWLEAGAVDSRLVRGMWVHRPAARTQEAGAA